MTISSTTQVFSGQTQAVTRAQAVWMVIMQLAALGLLCYALVVYMSLLKAHAAAGQLEPRMHLVLLAGLALVQLLVAVVPAWRRSPFAGVIGGVTLATACWLTAGVTVQADDPNLIMLLYQVPAITPVIVGVAVVLAVWGLFSHAGLGDRSRLGVAAIIGGVMLAAYGVAFYRLVNFSPAFKPLYHIESYQLIGLLAGLALYPAALWLGGAGVQPAGGWRVQPLGMALILGAFLVYMHTAFVI